MNIPISKALEITEYDINNEGIEGDDILDGTKFSEYIEKRHRIYIYFPDSDFCLGMEISKTKECTEEMYNKRINESKENLSRKMELYSWWLLVNDLKPDEKTYDVFHDTDKNIIMNQIKKFLITKALDYDYNNDLYYIINKYWKNFLI